MSSSIVRTLRSSSRGGCGGGCRAAMSAAPRGSSTVGGQHGCRRRRRAAEDVAAQGLGQRRGELGEEELLVDRLRQRPGLQPADGERVLRAPVVEIVGAEVDQRVLRRQRRAVASGAQVGEPGVDAVGVGLRRRGEARLLLLQALPQRLLEPPAVAGRERGAHLEVHRERE